MKAINSDRLSVARRTCIGLVLAALGVAAWSLLNLILSDFTDSTLAVRGTMTGAIMLVTSLLLLANLGVLGKDGRHELAWTAMMSSPIAASLWLTAIWRDWNRHDEFDWVWRGAICLFLASLWATVSGQIFMLKARSTLLEAARWAAVMAHGLGFLLIVLMVLEILNIEDRFGRGPSTLFTMLVVPLNLAALIGVVVVPMLIRMENSAGRKNPIESLDRNVAITLTCPRCGFEQSMKPGVRPCAGCQALMRVEIEEPRCECGYLLFRLSSPQCPECGRPVPHLGA